MSTPYSVPLYSHYGIRYSGYDVPRCCTRTQLSSMILMLRFSRSRCAIPILSVFKLCHEGLLETLCATPSPPKNHKALQEINRSLSTYIYVICIHICIYIYHICTYIYIQYSHCVICTCIYRFERMRFICIYLFVYQDSSVDIYICFLKRGCHLLWAAAPRHGVARADRLPARRDPILCLIFGH